MLSVILPAYNEAGAIDIAIERIHAILSDWDRGHEIIVVDDGSTDGTFDKVCALGTSYPGLKALRFSRNFGKESALLAGLEASRGDAVITMDADMQHPTELIPEMIEKWKGGVSVVHAVKADRLHDGPLVRLRAALFNAVLSKLAGIDVQGASDFKLLDRTVVDILVHQLPERRRFYRGLADWVGFEQVSIPYSVSTRAAGETKWSFFGLLDLAVTALVSFTSAPLRIVSILGLVTLAVGFIVASEAFWFWITGKAVSGFTTIIGVLLLIGSFIMISLGIIGEYIAKIYEELKDRPQFLVERTFGIDAPPGNIVSRPRERPSPGRWKASRSGERADDE